MASTPATSFGSNPKQQRSDTPALPSPVQTSCSDTEHTSTDWALEHDTDCDTVEATDNETIERAFQTIWDRFCALPTEKYPTFHFREPTSFDILQRQLHEHVGLSGFVEDQVRQDWNADTCDLTLRLMPTFIHDYFQESVTLILAAELDRIARESPELQATRLNILQGGHTDITRKHQFAREKSSSVKGNSSTTRTAVDFQKSPDGQFVFKGAKFPPFIFEIAYSEEEKKIWRKTQEYFSKIPGVTVLSFDLDYASPRMRRADRHTHSACASMATSMRHPEHPTTVVVKKLAEAEIFRDAGQVIQGELEIPFTLFVPIEQRDGLPAAAGGACVHLDFVDLDRILHDAEEQQRFHDATPTPEPEAAELIDRIMWEEKDGEVLTTLISEEPKPRPRRSKRTMSRDAMPGDQPRRSRRLRSASPISGDAIIGHLPRRSRRLRSTSTRFTGE
ncbi:hypothetical protein F5B18DRAFT_656318 [Nemania serpens]|nr:hypothetical protein F5B18DRAFT_656318 [Nemania serpens]